MRASAVAYKPVGMVLGAISGAVATLVFREVWKTLGHDQKAPGATDRERDWPEVLLAAALQGATFAVVRAAVQRGGATATERLTGYWPN